MQSRARVLGALALTGTLAVSALGQESPQGGKPQLGIFADTMKTAIPGLEGVELPPQALAALGGAAGQRSLRVHLWTPNKPPAAATASLDIPAGLKLGPTLPLALPKEGRASDRPDSNFEVPKGMENFEFHRYWGCSTTVKPGQPKIMKYSDFAAQAKSAGAGVRGKLRIPGAVEDAWTDASWPNALQKLPKPIEAGAGLPGKYALKSSYVTGVSFEVPANVDFLAPVELSIPKGQDVAKSIPVSWKPVPNAVGYLAMAMGQRGRSVSVMWTSVEKGDGTEFPVDFNTPAGVKALIEKGLCIPADRTSCSIPATAFQGCQNVSLQVYAFGPAFTQPDTTPSVRVQTRSMGTTFIQSGGE